MIQRQGKGEHASLTRYAFTCHPDATFMHRNQLLDNGQAKAGARRRQKERIFAEEETLEDAVCIDRINANAIIFHIHLHGNYA
jgi:hypothetical protein